MSPIYVNAQPYTLMAGTSSDASGISTVTWGNAATGGSGTATGTTSWSIANIALNVGSNVITVTATDIAGNTGTDVTTIILDQIIPVCTIVTPATSPIYTNAATYTLMAGTSSDASGIASVAWVNSLGGSGTATGTTSWSIASIALTAGSNVITVTATDLAGNLGTDVTTIIRDNINPVCTIVTPATSPIYTNAATYTLMAGTSSDASGIASVTWVNSLGGSGTATGTTSWSIASIALDRKSNV